MSRTDETATLRFEPGLAITWLGFAGLGCLLFGILLILSDQLGLGDLKDLGALKCGLVGVAFGIGLLGYYWSSNRAIEFRETTIVEKRSFFGRTRSTETPYSQVESVEVPAFSTEPSVYISLKTGTSIRITLDMSRTHGALAQTSAPEAEGLSERIREIYRLRDELLRRTAKSQAS